MSIIDKTRACRALRVITDEIVDTAGVVTFGGPVPSAYSEAMFSQIGDFLQEDH